MYRYTVKNSVGRKVVVEAESDEEVRGPATSALDEIYEKEGNAGSIPVAWDLYIVKKEPV